jgi:hypothetical protein
MADLSKDFFEEVSAIRDSVKEFGYKVDLAGWQKRGVKARERIWEALNLHAEALRLWDELCFPVRRRGNLVFRIQSPRDVMGTPIIEALPVDDYVRGTSIRTARAAVELAVLAKSRDRWRVAAAILGLVLLVVLIT